MKTKTNKQKSGRPTFLYKNNPMMEIRAGGLILYRHDKCMTEPEFLMIGAWNRYEDFGGRTDISDKSIEDTICREVDEESNGILPMEEMLELIKNEEQIYCEKSKYMVYVVKTKIHYNPIEFGDWEICDGIPRTVEWIKLSQLLDKKFCKKQLHIRLKFGLFFKKIRSIFNNTNKL
jgi:hypothetical protein